MDKKALISTRYPSSYRITEQIYLFFALPKINLQSFESTPDSLKQRFKAFERKRSLGAPEVYPRLINLFFRCKRKRVSVENVVSLQRPILEQLQQKRRSSHQLFCNDTMKNYKRQSGATKE